MMDSYSASQCDLCGSTETEVLVTGVDRLGMTSDSRLVQRVLDKRSCVECGLVREGRPFSWEELESHYRSDYVLNTTHREHVFFRDGRPVVRSAAIAEWMMEVLEAEGLTTSIETVFEMGAGQGELIGQLQTRLPQANFAGSEVSEGAVRSAQERGIDVRQGDYRVLTQEADLVVAFGVLEHVPSPKAFLRHIAAHVPEGGHVLVGQPTQEVESYDVFFVDHLHHFRTGHVELLAEACGFEQVAMSASPWFAHSFSLHLLRRTSSVETPRAAASDRERGAPRAAASDLEPEAPRRAVARWRTVFDRARSLDRTKRYALFGLGEMATLLYCYGGLPDLDLVLGLDDAAEQTTSNVFGVPVKRIDDLTEADRAQVDAVILSLNPRYCEAVAARCAAAGLDTINLYQD